MRWKSSRYLIFSLPAWKRISSGNKCIHIVVTMNTIQRNNSDNDCSLRFRTIHRLRVFAWATWRTIQQMFLSTQWDTFGNTNCWQQDIQMRLLLICNPWFGLAIRNGWNSILVIGLWYFPIWNCSWSMNNYVLKSSSFTSGCRRAFTDGCSVLAHSTIDGILVVANSVIGQQPWLWQSHKSPKTRRESVARNHFEIASLAITLPHRMENHRRCHFF